MKKKHTENKYQKSKSRTNTVRLRLMNDEEINYSDIPETSDDFWNDANKISFNKGTIEKIVPTSAMTGNPDPHATTYMYSLFFSSTPVISVGTSSKERQ